MGKPEETQDTKSSEELKDTSEKEPETFSKEQVEEAERKGKSDALAEIGRYKTSAENAIKAAKAAGERIDRMLKEQEESELEAVRDEPDKLTQIRARQTQRQQKSDLDERERKLKESEDEHAEALKAVVESTKEQSAREIATRLNVEAKTLVKLAKFTDGSLEAMEDLAKDLPKKGEAKTLTPDSGKTIGGGQTYKSEEILKTLDPSKMSPKEISDQVKKLREAAEEGRIK